MSNSGLKRHQSEKHKIKLNSEINFFFSVFEKLSYFKEKGGLLVFTSERHNSLNYNRSCIATYQNLTFKYPNFENDNENDKSKLINETILFLFSNKRGNFYLGGTVRCLLIRYTKTN